MNKEREERRERQTHRHKDTQTRSVADTQTHRHIDTRIYSVVVLSMIQV